MSETKTKIALTRWTLTGVSDGPQGLDGVPELARTAFEDMKEATWTKSADAPILPVHDFDRKQPSGDAFKAVFGYDADARTERSCCGAVCYSYRVPADALAGDPCNVEGVSVRLIGDRYLDAGAVVRVVCTGEEAPPPFSAFLNLSVESEPVCATAGQTDPSGEPLAPNKRSAVREDVAVELEETPAARFVHIGLFLADYLSARGAWIEGGAMLATASATVTFSRAVLDDPDPGTVVETQNALNLGILAGNADFAARLLEAPFVSARSTYQVFLAENYLAALADTSNEARVRNVLAALLAKPELYATQADEAERNTVESFGTSAKLAVASDNVTACALAFSGRTFKRVFDRLSFQNPIASDIPFHAVLFGIAGPLAISTTGAADPSPEIGTPLLSFKTVLDKTFLDGKASSILCRTSIPVRTGAITGDFCAEGETASVPGETLAVIDCPDGRLASIDFDQPFRSGYVSTVVLALVPNDAPLVSTGGSTAVSLTIRADTNFHSNLQAGWDRDANRCYWATEYSFMYSGMTAHVFGQLDLHFSATINGKTYEADEEINLASDMPSVATWNSTYYTPPGGTSAKTSHRATLKIPIPEIVGSVVLKAADESEVRVNYTIPARTVTRYAWAISVYSFAVLEWNDHSIGNLSNTATRSVAYAESVIDPGYPILQQTAALAG